MEIETDGTITPEQAFKEASEILMAHFSFLSKKIEKGIAKVKEEKKELRKKIGIDEIGISERTANILKENNIKTVGGLLKRKEETLLNLEGIGERSLKEIKKALKDSGFELKG